MLEAGKQKELESLEAGKLESLKAERPKIFGRLL
jgi:hypothetical protein